MNKKRSGLKGSHVEITGDEPLDSSTYILQVTTSLFFLTSSEELLRSASILEAYQKINLKKQIVCNNVFSTVRLLSGYALENIFKAIIDPNEKAEKSSLGNKRFFYVTIGKMGQQGGACVQFDLEIDPSKAAKMQRWTYKKVGETFVMVPYEK